LHKQRRTDRLYRLLDSLSSDPTSPSSVPSSVPSPGILPSPVPSPILSTTATPSSMPSPVPSDDSCGSAFTTGTTSDASFQSTCSSSVSQRNGPCTRIAVCKLKETRRLNKSRRSKTKLIYNYYVSPGDGWAFLGISDPSDDSLDVSLPSPSSFAFNQLLIPSSYDVIGTQDPFDFLDPDVSMASDECSSSSVSPIDGDSSSVSTVQHSYKGTERVTPSPSTNTRAGRVTPSPSIPLPGAGRVTDRFDAPKTFSSISTF